MPELQLSQHNQDKFKDEGLIYRHRRGYVSPVTSRRYVYNLIEMALEEDWPVVINDCSNDLKFYRGVHKKYNDDMSCRIEYQTEFGMLPKKYYLDVAEKYVEDYMEV